MEKKVYDKTRISMCCQAPVFVGGDDREGTHYYICEKCNKPCDSEGLNTDILFRELDKAREEGRREQQRLDCELYGTAVATNEEIEEKWNLSKLKNNDNMEVKEKMSEDFIRGYNEAIRDILAKRGMWAGADKKLLKELSNYLKEEK